MSLGPKFSIPHHKNDLPYFKLIADTEFILNATQDVEQQNTLRAQFTNIVTNFCKKSTINKEYLTLNKKYNTTKAFLKKTKDILIIKADKANKTVAIYKNDYETKMNELLSDKKTYKLIDNDITKKIQNKNNRIIKSLYDNNYIDLATKKNLTKDNSTAPRIYGLIKVHKQNYPLRPIVSGINSPLDKLSKFLANILKGLEEDEYYVKNSFDFQQTISHIKVPEGHIFISLDVVSLFTNIPTTLILDAIKEEWTTISLRTKIPMTEFLELISFCLNEGYFKFKDTYYKQIWGTAMGSSLSPVVANLVMDKLLKKVIPLLPYTLTFIKKYVDDLFLIVPRDKVDETLNIFNSYNTCLQFTSEIEEQQSLPFLDMTVIRNNDNTIKTKWYKKPSATTRYLNYNSKHPKNQLINNASNLISRALKLTSIEYHKQILEYVTYLLRQNEYPRGIIKSITNKIKQQINNKNNNIQQQQINNNGNNNDDSRVLERKYYSLPYIDGIAGKLKKLFTNNLNVKIAFTQNKTIGNLFSSLKDTIDKNYRSHVIYKIPCNNCQAQYTGQTKRYLQTRCDEHKRNCKNKNSNNGKCALVGHVLQTGHTFNFNETKILDTEYNLHKRLTLEMLYINNDKNNINLKTDISNLSNIYINILKFNNKNK